MKDVDFVGVGIGVLIVAFAIGCFIIIPIGEYMKDVKAPCECTCPVERDNG